MHDELTLNDLGAMSAAELRAARQRIGARLRDLLYDEHGATRDLGDSGPEREEFDRLMHLDSRAQAHEAVRAAFDRGGFESPEERPAERRNSRSFTRHPLAVSDATLDAVQHALDTRTTGRWRAQEELRATVTTAQYGGPRAWGSNTFAGPRLLHLAAGVEQQTANAVFANVPEYTLPTATASAGETASLAEFASVAPGSLTLARFGRWTDVSVESQVGTDATSLLSMHTLGIALDLDNALITLAQAAAGTAVAFTSDVQGNIRKAIAQVQANTAQADVSRVVVLANPADVALLEVVTATGGDTIGQQFGRFAGALVYSSNAVTAGFMTVAVLAAGVRFFEAQPAHVDSILAPKTGVLTLATSTIAGYAQNLAPGGWVIKQDVVTP